MHTNARDMSIVCKFARSGSQSLHTYMRVTVEMCTSVLVMYKVCAGVFVCVGWLV